MLTLSTNTENERYQMYTREERTYPGNEEGFDRRREVEWNQSIAPNNIPRDIGNEFSWKDVDQRRGGFEARERFEPRRRSRSRSPIHRRSPYRESRSDWRDSPQRRGGSPQGYDRQRNDRYDNRRRSPPRERNWERGASSSVVLQRVPEFITEDDVCEDVKRFGAPIVVVRIEYEQGPRGTSDRICVVEFQRTADAIGWMKQNEGYLWLKRERITMEYYNEGSHADDDRERSRERDFHDRDRRAILKSEPSNTMIVKGLLTTTTEESIRKSFEYITQFPIVAIRLVRHKLGVSRGFCFVEWRTTEDCKQVIEYLQTATPRFHIDGRHVTLDYSTPQNHTRAPGVQHSKSTVNAAGQVAEAAIQAAQWSKREQEKKDLERHKDSTKPLAPVQPKPSYQKVEKPVAGPKFYQPGQYPVPDTTKFRYDSTSGFYYDSDTGFYYDAKSRYFYNSKTQKYLYWDLNKRDYLAVTNEQQKPDEKKEKEEKKDKEQKSVNAKKIAKDMERWAKAQNKKKEEVKRTFDETPPPNPTATLTQVNQYRKESTADAAFKLLETQTNEIERQAAVKAAYKNDQFKKPDLLSTRKPPTSSNQQGVGAGLVSYQEDSDEEPAQEEEEEDEEKFLDWNKLACLLCRRGFSNKEMLVKHVDLSDLHRTNLEKRRKTKMGSMIPRKSESSEAPLKYRDRAAERRKNFGTTAPPMKRNQMGGRRAAVPFEQPTKDGLDETNIGNQMLQKMGWNKGRGLGKSQDGIVDPIKVQQRSRGSGLGMRGSTYGLDGTEGDYRSAAKRITYARFQESD